MIYENIIKVIPLIKSNNRRITLSNAYNIRIKHPEVHEIIPLYESNNNLDNPPLGIFYSQRVHRNGITTEELKLKRYELVMTDRDINS